MDAVHIVVLHQLRNAVADQIQGFLVVGVQVIIAVGVIVAHVLGVAQPLFGEIGGIHRGKVALAHQPVRVDPGMEGKAQLMGLLDKDLQGIVIRRLSGGAGDVFAPGVIGGRIDGVPMRAHLNKDRVHPLGLYII